MRLSLAFCIAFAIALSPTACGVRVSLGYEDEDASGDASFEPPTPDGSIDADDEGDVFFEEPEDAADE